MSLREAEGSSVRKIQEFGAHWSLPKDVHRAHGALSPDSVLAVDIPGPNLVDCLVGLETMSSSLSLTDTSGQMVVDSVNITQTLMDIRKKVMLAGITEENACVANFIVKRDLLNSTFEPKVLDAVFPITPPTYLEETEVAMVAMISSMGGMIPFEELSQVGLRHNTCSTQSIVTRTINNYFSEALRLEILRGARSDVTYKPFAFVFTEIKTSASSADTNADLAKLFTMAKRSVDELYTSGFHWPVIVFQARGVTIDMYEFAIASEAIYHPNPLGSFKAPATHLDFGLLLGLTPKPYKLRFKAIKFGRTADLPKHWTQGTFDVRGISVSERFNPILA
ncbi:hypothetical protein BGZ47_011058 [Haplosporangium gracile]|nr:hypothetical protein BGZ47_011058 [Haplosporangium gracile]